MVRPMVSADATDVSGWNSAQEANGNGFNDSNGYDVGNDNGSGHDNGFEGGARDGSGDGGDMKCYK